MAKNENKNSTTDIASLEQTANESKVETVALTSDKLDKSATKAEKPAKENVDKKSKDAKKSKEKKPSKVGKKFKETVSELKKVSWPTFGTVVKKTGVVLAVVLIFAVVLFGIDRLLAWLFDLLTSSIG